ncbi:MAG TPA: hypothetical protein VFD32_12225 [Dehalococcoidia bacterium]|nr:hypothetical protein [Dehalococcoidia bacterium]
MRPNTPELVRGLSANLLTELLPRLDSAWTQAQLRSVVGLLESIAAEWDGAADQLARENADLQNVCAQAAAVCERPDAEAELTALARALRDAAALPPTPDLRLSTLAARNAVLWQAVIPLIELIAGPCEAASWAAGLKQVLGPVLRRHVAGHAPRPAG